MAEWMHQKHGEDMVLSDLIYQQVDYTSNLRIRINRPESLVDYEVFDILNEVEDTPDDPE
jgi:hypothetical protein